MVTITLVPSLFLLSLCRLSDTPTLLSPTLTLSAGSVTELSMLYCFSALLLCCGCLAQPYCNSCMRAQYGAAELLRVSSSSACWCGGCAFLSCSFCGRLLSKAELHVEELELSC